MTDEFKMRHALYFYCKCLHSSSLVRTMPRCFHLPWPSSFHRVNQAVNIKFWPGKLSGGSQLPAGWSPLWPYSPAWPGLCLCFSLVPHHCLLQIWGSGNHRSTLHWPLECQVQSSSLLLPTPSTSHMLFPQSALPFLFFWITPGVFKT